MFFTGIVINRMLVRLCESPNRNLENTRWNIFQAVMHVDDTVRHFLGNVRALG